MIWLKSLPGSQPSHRGQGKKASLCEHAFVASAVADDLADLIVSTQIGERQQTRFYIENEPKCQPNATLEDAVTQPPNTEARVQMRTAESIAHRGNCLTNSPSLSFW